MQLAKNFYLSELTRSQTAARQRINNTPPAFAINNLKNLAQEILQPVRDRFGVVVVSSGYRSFELNRRIGGAPSSQHISGLAADFECPGIANETIAKWIVDNLTFDQCILEHYNAKDPNSGWVHCSLLPLNRKQYFTIG